MVTMSLNRREGDDEDAVSSYDQTACGLGFMSGLTKLEFY